MSERDRCGFLFRHSRLEADGRWPHGTLARVAGPIAQVTTYAPDVTYVHALLAAQRAAREAGRGLWGAAP